MRSDEEIAAHYSTSHGAIICSFGFVYDSAFVERRGQKMLLAQQFATVNSRNSSVFQRSQQLISATVNTKEFHSIHDFSWPFLAATVSCRNSFLPQQFLPLK